MKERVKYPLTPEAKEVARQLVQDWKHKKIEQLLIFVEEIRHSTLYPMFLDRASGLEHQSAPKQAILMELAEYKLISMKLREGTRSWDVLLLQELCNAVENDLTVSDFFLTTSAIGTVVYGNLEVREGGSFQSAATNIGDITQTSEALTKELKQVLGMELLQQAPELNHAIEGLKTADEPNRARKAGKVIEELGRCMAHMANAGNAITAIAMIIRFLGG